MPQKSKVSPDTKVFLEKQQDSFHWQSLTGFAGRNTYREAFQQLEVQSNPSPHPELYFPVTLHTPKTCVSPLDSSTKALNQSSGSMEFQKVTLFK